MYVATVIKSWRKAQGEFLELMKEVRDEYKIVVVETKGKELL
jgi:hypothetical protein